MRVTCIVTSLFQTETLPRGADVMTCKRENTI